MGITGDRQVFTQERGRDIGYREPGWRNKIIEEPPETAFPVQDIYGEDATYRLSIMDLRLERESVQIKVKAKTMRNQASLLSVLVEVTPKHYL